MELSDCIRGRRSVRQYMEKPVEAEKVQAILDAAAMAPTARNTQQWRFTVVEKREEIKRLSEETKMNLGLLGRGLDLAELISSKDDTIFYSAPLLILVSAKRGDKWAHIDCGIAAENMMLAAYDMGLGSCYIGFANSLNNDRKILMELAVPEDYEIIAPLIFGYPKKQPAQKERKVKVLKWIK
ncbi:MAG: nitroreductase family protein [Candidatus Altiarchaeota archaeon]